MSIETDIQAALDAKTATLALPTAWMNKKFVPTIGTDFIRPTNLPAATEGLVLKGVAARYKGLYQIDVFCEAGNGKLDATTIVNSILAAFVKDDILTYGSTLVAIGNVYLENSAVADGWFIQPVIIQYNVTQ